MLFRASLKVMKDAGANQEVILMWAVNFGLNLNETTSLGPRSVEIESVLRAEARFQWV